MPLRFADATASAYAYPLLIRHLLHTPLSTAAAQEIVSGDQRFTYRELEGRIHRLASALNKLGVSEGTTVAVMDWDTHRYLECFFAVPMMGAVLQTVNVRLAPEQIRWTMQHAHAQILLIHADFFSQLDELRQALPHLRAVVLLRDATDDVRPSGADIEYEHMLTTADHSYPFADFDENAIATTFYTTGTSGPPKGVCFTHRQLVLHTLALMGAIGTSRNQGFHHGDVYMPLTPMFHVHAWGLPYVATLMGAKQVYPGRFDAARTLRLREREAVSYSHCVPTILRMLLSEAERTGTDLRGWKITIGGSALTAPLARDALARGVDVFAAYGMSESGPVLTITRLPPDATTLGDDGDDAIRCRTGLPVPLVDLRLVDQDFNDVARDGTSVGELVVRAPWLTPCYVGDATGSERLWHGGYLHTQDVASIDSSGYVQIRDRLKDVIKSGGEWVSSLLLEEMLARHDGVREAAVLAIPDERWGERPVALVVVKPGVMAPSEQELKGFCATQANAGLIPRYAIPDRIVIVSALDKTSVGKLDKKRMRERLR